MEKERLLRHFQVELYQPVAHAQWSLFVFSSEFVSVSI